VISIFLVNIVMLNLLIAIISLSFERINDNAQSADYQERARLISENVYLIPEIRKARYSKKGQHLVIASEFGEGFGREDNEDQEVEVENEENETDKRIVSLFNNNLIFLDLTRGQDG
jgi:regulatory protein YycI of two-component signal transduction system YycFG